MPPLTSESRYTSLPTAHNLIKNLSACIVLIFALMPAGLLADSTVIKFPKPWPVNTPESRFALEVFKLAMEKTIETHGRYELNLFDYPARKRVMRMISRSESEVVVSPFAYRSDWVEDDNIAFVEFPIFLGLFGYRICFVSDTAKSALSSVERTDQLKEFLMVQGENWVDAEVLRENGFSVKTAPNLKRMARMILGGQADLFCRGINEIKSEKENAMQSLSVDTSMALHYSQPHFFVLHKNEKALKKRIELGLILAYQDGSLMALWESTFKESLDFVNLQKREIFELKNSSLNALDKGYRSFEYRPE